MLLFILMPFESVFSQVIDLPNNLPNIGSLIDGRNNTVKEQDYENNDNQDDAAKSAIAKQEYDFRDDNYGYTGGKNFINPPSEKFFSAPLSYFGYDFFVNSPTMFSPPTGMPIPPDYVIGPNDSVKIILYGNRNATYMLKVTREGEIFFPSIGPISVAGLTFHDFKETIQQIVANQLIGTKATVSMGKLRTVNIFVLGEANQPGMYSVDSLTTLTNAIFKSGGVNTTGSLRNIQLKRQGKVISTFDFYDLLLNGDTSNDARLMPGDVVFIPPISKTIGVTGAVGRQGIYELKERETLKDVIKYAGNLKPKADIFSGTLHRIDLTDNGFSLIPVDLTDSSAENFEIINGDVLSVHSVIDNLKNAVLVTGHAQQPGFYPWREGMRIGDLVNSPNDLLSMTDVGYVLIKREGKLSQNYEFVQVDLEEVLKNDQSKSNIFLFDQDEIIFLPNLLTPEQITTKIIQDKYLIENNQLILKDREWNTLPYLRKSLMEESLTLNEMNELVSVTGEDSPTAAGLSEGSADVRRYYEYSIYNYCTLPDDMAIKFVEETGFRTNKLISLDKIEQLQNPDDFTNLMRQIENEQIELERAKKSNESDTGITDYCRRQLLDPVIEIINRKITPSKEKRVISVHGSVQFPGMYPLTEGMVLGDAIKAAGGLKEATYESEIELIRSENVGKKFSISQSFVSLSNPQTMQTSLQAMDIINLKQLTADTRTVTITGEVYFSGIYPIAENQTLSELIRRAGGMTEYGSAKATFFQRESLKKAEIERLQVAAKELRKKIVLSSSQTAGLGREENELDSTMIEQIAALLVDDLNEYEALGRLVVDLESITKGLIPDVILEDGDTVHIPKVKQSVSVIGEVYVENSHIFEKNLSINDYVNLSGGITEFASEENIYIIKSDGRIVSSSDVSNRGFFRGDNRLARGGRGLQPGDTVVVPLEVVPFSGIRASTQVTQIIYQMALAAAAINSF